MAAPDGDVMRRLWILPLFAALFLGFQLVWEAVNFLSVWITLRSSNTDFYLHPAPFSLFRFLPMIAIGAGCGLIFAILDFALHRGDDPGGGAALSFLLRHLRREGIVGLMLNCLAVVPIFGFSWWETRHRYHPHSPEFQFMEWLSYFLPLILLITLLLVMGKTLARK